MRYSVLLLLAVLSFLPHRGWGQDSAQPPFLFAEDDKAQPHSKFRETIDPKRSLREDAWLNAPVSRLDYVLLTMDMRLAERIPPLVHEIAAHYFERIDINGVWMPLQIETSVIYFDEIGRLFLSAEVKNLGKPKKPMKEFCELVANAALSAFPQEPRGFTWHNNALTRLIQDDGKLPVYQDVVRKLMDASMVSVQVDSGYKLAGKDQSFLFSCRKQARDKSFEFFKHSWGTLLKK